MESRFRQCARLISAALRRQAFAAVAAALVVGLAGAPARALEVEEVIWGFDGQVVPYRFNPLSVLVSNPTPEPFDGALQLRRNLAGRMFVGARLVEPLFLDAFSQRWVQFYPYVMNDGPYELSWGRRRDEQYEIPTPRHGPPARVVLSDSSALTRRSGALKAFPDQLFPPTVTATDSLRLVALNHAPRWETVRQQALYDWILAGGVVHLFENAGRFPEFSGKLTRLNAPVEVQRIGAGVVHRHRRSLSELDQEFVETVLYEREPRTDEEQGEETDAVVTEYEPNADWSVDGKIFSALKGMTRPDHNWVMLHAMSLVYLALIFPGLYFLGGKRADYRLVFGATLGLAGLFSWAFSVVGRRGYDETTTVNSVAIARPLDEGAWSVSGWSNAFVTRGDDYMIEHAGVGRLYSTCQNIEAVNGAIHGGLEGFFRVDIPPYSSRTFGYRARIESQPLGITVETVEADTELLKLVVRVGEGFPEQGESMHAVYRDRVYPLRWAARGQLSLAGKGQPVAQFLPEDQLGGFSYGYYDPWSDEHSGGAEEIFKRLGTPMMGYSLGVSRAQETTTFSLPDDRVRLLIYAPMPEEFFIQNPALGQQAGYVLYSVDLPIEVAEAQ